MSNAVISGQVALGGEGRGGKGGGVQTTDLREEDECVELKDARFPAAVQTSRKRRHCHQKNKQKKKHSFGTRVRHQTVR